MTDELLRQSRGLAWSVGDKEVFLESRGMMMTHDELAKLLGDAYSTIIEAGFALVPKIWKEDVFKHFEVVRGAARNGHSKRSRTDSDLTPQSDRRTVKVKRR